MNQKEVIKLLQSSLNVMGENLKVDGDFGPKTEEALKKYQLTVELKKKSNQAPVPSSKKDPPPWFLFALRFRGKKESDPEFNKDMSKKWSLFGMNLGTIQTSWAAWCGLAMAVALSGVGIDYQKNGALARNWALYGEAIDWKNDGIPQGAIVHINQKGDCKSSASNHVAQANGDCTAQDLSGWGASIDLYGGNQGNTWKVSTYPAKNICAVRWPKDVKDFPRPGKITVSKDCSSKNTSQESTR